MTKRLASIKNDLECAVDYFRPVLQSLQIRRGETGFPVFLQSFPHLWDLDGNGKWVIMVLKAKLVDSKARFVSKYYPNSGIMACYIVIDEACFIDARVPKELRKTVAVHEFCHFLALIYASISTSEETLQEKLKERLSRIIDDLTNEKVLKLYQFLNKVRPLSDDFITFEQTRDEHFRLDCDNLDLSYTDLFRNFLLSRQMFDEFFSRENKQDFFDLLRNGNAQGAFDSYLLIAKEIAQEKWLPENFAINQAIEILLKYYLIASN